MNRKNLPLLLMLTAGAATSIVTYIKDYPLPMKLVALLGVLILFYVLGNAMMWILDYFEKQNAERLQAEGEGTEKEPELSGAVELDERPE